MSHSGAEETLLDEGETASGLWCVLVLGFGFGLVFFVWFWGCLCSFPSSCCVSFPFNDDLDTPPTWRLHSWKKMVDLRINEGDQFLLYLRNLPEKGS